MEYGACETGYIVLKNLYAVFQVRLHYITHLSLQTYEVMTYDDDLIYR